MNFLRNLFINIRLAAILSHARRYICDEQDGVATFNRQHRSTFLKAIMFADQAFHFVTFYAHENPLSSV
ncbi:MAG: hypothetical protein AUG51_10240 [Acidobacteria bacterium 13_1_20CM_3_53_8]|nr:MAG: hypothetical protein AUG51_10240 [Acidobacteria bacterium 13_1_20CM_3_53_8]